MTEEVVLSIKPEVAIQEKSNRLGVCPDCLERELVRTLPANQVGSPTVREYAIHTCRNCGYQDERYYY